MGLRWAFSLSLNDARSDFEALFRRALLCLPREDVAKQDRFHFRNDALACVVGRLMIRAAAHSVVGTPWHAVEVLNEDRGKPYLAGNPFYFNVSHQGDIVVLATSRTKKLGVDVMKIDEERGSTATDHIERMQKLFTIYETDMMKGQIGERSKWTAFYRIWCLKEAVLKATGTGLVNDLRTIAFTCSSQEEHRPGSFLTSTQWSERGIAQENWGFEESFIGDDHCVAVGKIYGSEREAKEAKLRSNYFQLLNLEEILQPATVLYEEEVTEMYDRYISKPWKDF